VRVTVDITLQPLTYSITSRNAQLGVAYILYRPIGYFRECHWRSLAVNKVTPATDTRLQSQLFNLQITELTHSKLTKYISPQQ